MDISQIINKVFAKKGLKKKFTQYKAFEKWDEIVGKHIAQFSQPHSIQGNTLIVTVTSSAWMNELQMMKMELLEKISTATNSQLINNIRFKIGTIDKNIKGLVEYQLPNITELTDEQKKFIENSTKNLKDTETADIISHVMQKALSHTKTPKE